MNKKQQRKIIYSISILLIITNGMWATTNMFLLHETDLGKEVTHIHIHGDGFEFAGASIYDVNRDKVIDMLDAGCIWGYINNQMDRYPYDFEVWKTKIPNKFAERLYDVNCDGVVNETDYNEVLKWRND